MIRQLAAGFHALGLQPGETVCIHSFNSIWHPIFFQGVVAAGGVYAGTNPAYTAHELAHALKRSIPPACRVFHARSPTVVTGPGPVGPPAVEVREGPPDPDTTDAEPDEVAVMAPEPAADMAVLVSRGGRLVAAVEIVAPRHKDHPDARATYAAAYAGYLRRGEASLRGGGRRA